MIDIRHRIHADAGRIRVLRLVVDGNRVEPLRYHARPGPGLCRMCGCTDQYGCAGGCSWVNREHTLCSRCLERRLLP